MDLMSRMKHKTPNLNVQQHSQPLADSLCLCQVLHSFLIKSNGSPPALSAFDKALNALSTHCSPHHENMPLMAGSRTGCTCGSLARVALGTMKRTWAAGSHWTSHWTTRGCHTEHFRALWQAEGPELHKAACYTLYYIQGWQYIKLI